MKLASSVFDQQAFLKDVWQQQPALFRGALADFEDPVEPEILAGLAMENDADSRIVRCDADSESGWQVEHGPFEDYERFGETDWTLLVQSVNEWLPSVAELLPPFRFLPQWRVDDVMVSFSCEGGGVGPHLDQYDVFIIQGAGRRRWQVGARQQMTNWQPCADLTQVKESFEPVIDEVLQAGDVLYIPAGCPHNGVALEPSLNYSVGFRAPSQAEWLMQIADQAMQTERFEHRYQDPDLSQESADYVVDANQLSHCKQLLQQAIASDDCDDLLLRVMSQSKRPLVEPDLPYVAEQMVDLLQQPNAVLARAAGARWLYSPQQQTYYSNGERFQITKAAQPLAKRLAELSLEQSATDYRPLVDSTDAAELLAELLNQGVFQLFLDSE